MSLEKLESAKVAAVGDDGRLLFLGGVLFCAWMLIALRLVELQLVRHEEFVSRTKTYQRWEEVVPGRPGDILDRHGRLLATSILVESLFVDPARVDHPEELADQLAEILDLDATRLRDRIVKHRQRRFLWIKRRLPEREAALVRQLGFPSNVLGFRREFQRHYLLGEIASHLLGWRDIDNRGQGGVEEAFEPFLQGVDGKRTLQRDARGFVLEILETSACPPRHGNSVQLTIDTGIQWFTEQTLDQLVEQWAPRSACAIVMEPRSGEILAMASRPRWNRTRPAETPPGGWVNHAIGSRYEPGSTFKPLIVSWAFETGAIDREETIDCEGGLYRMGPRVLHDHHRYGELSIEDILVKSSNIGMAKIGERLTNEGIFAACRAFGFGKKTGIGLPGEDVGRVRDIREWDRYSTGSIPMGQEIAVTPIQMITAYAALANGGRRVLPQLLHSHGRSEENSSFAAGRAIISEEHADWIVTKALTGVVQRGTGRRAQIEGIDVFGKTGTSQKTDPKTGRYSNRRHVCSFLCGAPADEPRVLVLVLVDEPTAPGVHYGGTVAAPAARDILEKALLRMTPK